MVVGGPNMGVWRATHEEATIVAQQERLTRPPLLYPDRELCITSTLSDLPWVHKALQQLAPGKLRYASATGGLALTVILGESDAFYRNRNNTKRWDICAVEALVREFGGALGDREGRAYDYDATANERGYDNVNGILVTLDPQVERKIVEQIHQCANE